MHAAQIPFRGQARMAVAAAMAGWEESGRPGLAEYIQSVPDVVKQQALGETLAERKVLSLGPQKALAWTESLPPNFAA